MARLLLVVVVALVVIDQTFEQVHLPLIIAVEPVDTPTITPTATATPTATPGVCRCDRDALNCVDFDDQPEAQACFDWCLGQGAGDIHKLDQDNDGTACESLPPGFHVRVR